MEESQKVEEYAAQYSAILRAEVEDNWLRGDIAIVVTDIHNKEREERGKSKVIDQFLEKTGEARSTFSQYRWVASVFDDETVRHLPVTWTHYRICASVDDPIAWLKKAHDNKWSCNRLIDEIKAAKLDKEIEAGIECAHCNKTVSKDESVTIGYKRKRRILCSLLCAQEHIKEMLADEMAKKVNSNTIQSSVDEDEMADRLAETYRM